MKLDPYDIVRNNIKYFDNQIPRKHLKILASLDKLSPGFASNAIKLGFKSLGHLTRGGILVFSGAAGHGKTIGACACGICYAIALNIRLHFVTAHQVLQDEFSNDEWLYRDFRGLVIVDDLGREYFKDSGWGLSVWDAFIDAAYSNEYPRIFTTNLTPEELRDRYQERIYDRLREVATWLTIVEPSGSLRGAK